MDGWDGIVFYLGLEIRCFNFIINVKGVHDCYTGQVVAIEPIRTAAYMLILWFKIWMDLSCVGSRLCLPIEFVQ